MERIRPVEVGGRVVYRVEPGILKDLADAVRWVLSGGLSGSSGGPPFDVLLAQAA